ncbi:MAG: bifunctional phosphoribosyl-AMP cyclohydrolase/phosphoribosyl-ATP diphosphatase HisIE [Thermodesulfobacteriota bacterium]
MADISKIEFDDKGLVPAVAQEATTGEVLMVAYMNREALEKTLESGRAHYFSRSRQKLWMKGETSGNIQKVRSVRYDCDCDTVLLKVDQTGPACHTNARTCFFNRMDNGRGGGKEPAGPDIIARLYQVILDRKKEDASPEKSYVASLYEKGTNKIAQKIHEESAEFINAAKKEGKDEVVSELCDLWFHTLIMLGRDDIAIGEVFAEFERRFGTSGIEEKESRKKKSGKKE